MSISELQLGDGSGLCWESATDQLVDSVADKDLFGPHWAKQQQAHLFALDKQATDWADSLVLLTATASTVWPTGDSIPPTVHFKQGILCSTQARQKALSRALKGIDWRAVRVYGCDDDGYLHRHTGLYIGETGVDRSAFDSWISAHTRNSALAEPGAHGDSAVRIDREVEVEDGCSWIAGYLMTNIPSCDTRDGRDHGIGSAPTNVQRGAAILNRVDEPPITFGKAVN